MGRLEGKVAFITGAARGQGRSHAVRFAEEGADIIGVDMCSPMETVPYPLPTRDDLDETMNLVQERGRRAVVAQADVRDGVALATALQAGVAELGRLDIVCANAGIFSYFPEGDELPEQAWQDLIDIDLTGAWNTCQASLPYLQANGGGSIIITSSLFGLKGAPGFEHYVAAKHGLVGLMRALASEFAPEMIRVNTVHPTNVDGPIIQNDFVYRTFRPDLDAPGRDDVVDLFQQYNAMPIPWVDPEDVTNAVLFLASDEARYVTGVALPVDAGALIK